MNTEPDSSGIENEAAPDFPQIPGVSVFWNHLFLDSRSDEFLRFDTWPFPVIYFAGRNGSYKSRTAKLIANQQDARYLSTDRLVSLMTVRNYQWGSLPQNTLNRGLPLSDDERGTAGSYSRVEGLATDDIYASYEQPDVLIKVAAFLKRALGREVFYRESGGFLDPFIRHGNDSYSLLRDEGHGLRELVVLLTAIYRQDWQLIVVDEPELHLHPAMTRLWAAELERECKTTNRRAIIVTHEPSLLRPKSAEDLSAIYYFRANSAPTCLGFHVRPEQTSAVTQSLIQNPELISQLVVSPRPVLVEGVHDVTALTTAIARLQPPEVVSQTDFIRCGSNGGVALWFSIASDIGLDFKAVADLDSVLTKPVQRVMDNSEIVTDLYRTEFTIEPPKTTTVLEPLSNKMGKVGVENTPKARALWLASEEGPQGGDRLRISKLIEVWRQAGLWLHPQGTLEAVLGSTEKGISQAASLAATPGAIDEVANWCAFNLDAQGDIERLLNIEVERIVQRTQLELRVNPTGEIDGPVGSTSKSDARLVQITPLGNGKFKVTVNNPSEFNGYWLEFSRETSPSQLMLKEPAEQEAGA